MTDHGPPGQKRGGKGRSVKKPLPTRKRSARLEGVPPSPLATEQEWENQPSLGSSLLAEWIFQVNDWIRRDADANESVPQAVLKLAQGYHTYQMTMHTLQTQTHWINEIRRLNFPYTQINKRGQLQFWRKGGRNGYKVFMTHQKAPVTPPIKNPNTAGTPVSPRSYKVAMSGQSVGSGHSKLASQSASTPKSKGTSRQDERTTQGRDTKANVRPTSPPVTPKELHSIFAQQATPKNVQLPTEDLDDADHTPLSALTQLGRNVPISALTQLGPYVPSTQPRYEEGTEESKEESDEESDTTRSQGGSIASGHTQFTLSSYTGPPLPEQANPTILAQAIQDMRQSIHGLQARVVSMDNDKHVMQAKIADLQADRDHLQTQISQLQSNTDTPNPELHAYISQLVQEEYAKLVNDSEYKDIIKSAWTKLKGYLVERSDKAAEFNARSAKQISAMRDELLEIRDMADAQSIAWKEAYDALLQQWDRTYEQKSASITLLYDDHLQTMRTKSTQVKSEITDHSITMKEEAATVTKQLDDKMTEYKTNLETHTQMHLGRATSNLRTQLRSIVEETNAQWHATFEDQRGIIQADIDSLESHISETTKQGLENYGETIRNLNAGRPHGPPDQIPEDHEGHDEHHGRDNDTSTANSGQRVPTSATSHSRWQHVNDQEILNGTTAAERRAAQATVDQNQYSGRRGSTSAHARSFTTASSTDRYDKWADPEYCVTSLRRATHSLVLDKADRVSILSFANSFIDLLRAHRIPVRSIPDMRVDQPAYPAQPVLSPALITKYSAAIYNRLEDAGVLNTDILRFQGLLTQHNETRDGYMVFQQLVRPHLPKSDHNKDMQALASPPTYTGDIYTHAAALSKFSRLQREANRNYSHRECALLFLQAVLSDSTYQDTAKEMLHDFSKMDKTAPLATKYHLESMPGTMEEQYLVSHPEPVASINAARSYQDNRNRSDRDQRRPSRYDDRNSGRQVRFDDRQNDRQPRGRANDDRYRESRRPEDRQSNKRSDRIEAQCEACGLYGHRDPSSCNFLPRVALCLQFLKENGKMQKGWIQAWLHRNDPKVRKQAREKMVKTLGVYLNDTDEIEAIADSLVADEDYYYSAADDQDNTVADDETVTITRLACGPTIAEIKESIQPVRFPPVAFCNDDVLPPLKRRLPSSVKTFHKMTRCETKRKALGDSGANHTVTNDPSLLHNYTTTTRYSTKGYDNVPKKAAGEGILKVVTNTGDIEDHVVIHCPEVDGTIISVEHHAQTNPEIYYWIQKSAPHENRGWITFLRQDNSVVSEYDTIKMDGLYYLHLTIVPPACTTRVNQIKTSRTHPQILVETVTEDEAQRLQMHLIDQEDIPSLLRPEATMAAPFRSEKDSSPTVEINQHTCSPCRPPSPTSATEIDDFDLDLDTEYIPHLIHHATATIFNPIKTDIKEVNLATATKQERDLLNFEIWHQRMAHATENKLRQTQRHVDGMPDFEGAKLPEFVSCRACDIARLKKAPRGPPRDEPPDLLPGEQFQMDIGFFRGPSNLAEVVDRLEEANMKIIESRQGFVCYLLIIDRKSRKIWTFPLKSKSVPLELIETFLNIHGSHDDTKLRTIKTDGEKTLAMSEEFRTSMMERGFAVQPTATDSSSQIGMAERPHQTFGIMMRCLLYAAGQPMTFWADALVYANYIYDRTYHSAIRKTPFEAWTGNRPTVKHLRMWGAHVTVKKSGDRPTKADPNHYDGIFLRFSATEKNIVYFDKVTKREKLARHCTMDEFHFGSNTRPPGAQAVLDTAFPNLEKLPRSSGDIYAIPLDEAPEPLEQINCNPSSPPIIPDTTAPPIPTVAAAAKVYAQMSPTEQEQEAILNMEPSDDIFAQSTILKVPIDKLPTLGFVLRDDPTIGRTFVINCQEGSKASRIKRWKSTIRNAAVLTIDKKQIKSEMEFRMHLAEVRSRNVVHVHIEFAKIDVKSNGHHGAPQLHFDQLRHIHRIVTTQKDENDNEEQYVRWYFDDGEEFDMDDLTASINLTRRQVLQRDDSQLWTASEYAQLDKYRAQGMFGDPQPRPKGSVVLPFVWTYLLKEGNPKARATCNGGKRFGRMVTMAETYASGVEQPACRVFWGLCAADGFIVLGADAGNAFAEAPPPDQPFYMVIDAQFNEWWTKHLGREPIPEGYVLPVNHALQGHPEAPRLWQKHINGILKMLHFVATTHEQSLYVRGEGEDKILFLRQVDDFAVGTKHKKTAEDLIAQIGDKLIVPLNHLGIIAKFNGVNVQQTRHFIKISCEDYLHKILTNHGWEDLKASDRPIPMRSDSTYQSKLELADRPTNATQQQAIQDQAGFSYRMAIGELIYALIVARPDISLATTKLSQYSANPALCHYEATKQVFAYLANTKDDGLVYWRKEPRMDLPDIPVPTPRSNPNDIIAPRYPTDLTEAIAFSDSDWGSDRAHRRSITAILIMLAGAAILYKTIYQKAIALSSCEAEFVAASDTGKNTLYVRSLMTDLKYRPPRPTFLMIDNHGAVFMISAQAPTKRTRHVEIRHFALLQWAENDYIVAKPIPTDLNPSDSFTKATGRIKFHQHADIYMGRHSPQDSVLPDSPTHKDVRVYHVSAITDHLVHEIFEYELDDVNSMGG